MSEEIAIDVRCSRYADGTPAVGFRYRVVANGQRSSPNKRPLVWDVQSRRVYSIPPDGVVKALFEPEDHNSDAGWVHRCGTGGFQLRVESPPGSEEPMVKLMPEYNVPEHSIKLYEARAKDPGVPEGKTFACIVCDEVETLQPLSSDAGEHALKRRGAAENRPMTYIMNAQSLEDLEFGIDIVDDAKGGRPVARGFVTVDSIKPLEGHITVPLLSLTDLKLAGTFHATFLVVKELYHPQNTLCQIQRMVWSPKHNITLDIGHRGSGASKVQGHSVRENTLLSFQKAAINHTDFIEFDVHLTSDNEVVVHHDFEVKLAVGKEEIKVALPLLRSDQVRSAEFAQSMVSPSEHRKSRAIKEEKSRREFSLKRTMTSGEDMFRTIFYKPMHSISSTPPSDQDNIEKMRVFLSDHSCTSLRQAFKQTPPWLGFNIELKYPTEEEIVAMGTTFYSRNFFVDAVLSTVLEEGGQRRVIFSTFDPACAELLRLKQCKYNVFFLTCGGTKTFTDPRMNSVGAALQFAKTSHLQGVVAEISSIIDNLECTIAEFHRHGLFLFTYGDLNNDLDTYSKQKLAGIDAIIMDDVARIGKTTNKKASLLDKTMRSPSSLAELRSDPSIGELQLLDLDQMASEIRITALSPIGSPEDSFFWQ